jgi:F-type H+-transporting ATPase subunit delta
MLASPVIRGEKKSKIFRAIFHGKVTDLTESFFDLVFRKGREFVMQDIGAAFDEQYNKIKKIVRVIITTATPIDHQLSQEIYDRVAALPRFHDMTIQLEEKVDPKIIAGFILNAGDYKFDASVRHDLQFIKHEFISNLYKMKI